MLRLVTFGGLHLETDGVRRDDLDGQAQILALLAVLAAAGNRGVSRVAVARIFWPHSVKGSDRTALSAALYRLRGILGADVVKGSDTLCLNPTAIGSDLAEFEACIARQAFDRAAQLYEGEFLQGFSLRATDSFNQWAEDQRARLALECRHALEALVSAAQERGDRNDAITWLRRLVRHAPHDSGAVQRLEQALADSALRSTVVAGPAVSQPAVAAPLSAPGGPVPVVGSPNERPVEPARAKWRVGTRRIVLSVSIAASVAMVYLAARALGQPVRVLVPSAGDTVDVRTEVTVVSTHEDHWLWIRTSGGCFLRGPFRHDEGRQYKLLAQFGQDGTRQSGYPYWIVVLAGPKLVPHHRVEDRRLDNCRYELLDPDAWSDTVLVYRR